MKYLNLPKIDFSQDVERKINMRIDASRLDRKRNIHDESNVLTNQPASQLMTMEDKLATVQTKQVQAYQNMSHVNREKSARSGDFKS
jgi:hypothetical protein